MAKPIILCVDDEKVILDSLWDQISGFLSDEFDCELCESGTEALELIDEYQIIGKDIAVIISDQLMPDMRGDQFLIQAHLKIPQTIKIMLTGQASFEAVQNAINKARLYRYIPKPWAEDDLILTVGEAARSYLQYLQLIEYNRILKSLNKATQEISCIIEHEELLKKLMENVLYNTGGEKCYLVVQRHGSLSIEASAQRDNTGNPSGELGAQLNGKAQRILQNIENLIFSSDAFPPNVLFTPIKNNGNDVGYIYVDNSEDSDPFNNNHLEVIQMLASQAAISLENARLYASLEDRARELQNEKAIVEQQNEIIAQRATEISEQHAKLEEVNKIVAQKNSDIIDSIQYAQRIQFSVMPDINILQSVFEHSFIHYKPKDIVSGDFYWWHLKKNTFTIAICDCTGHGVPGAFMSLLGINFLNQVVHELHINSPSDILSYLHFQFSTTLTNYSDKLTKEGMDCGILVFDLENKKGYFSGARRPLFLRHNNEWQSISGTKASIGENYDGKPITFEQHEFELVKDDLYYLFSDGVTDQFGGAYSKKFTPRKLKLLIEDIQDLTMLEQSKKFEQSISEWQGDNIQTDDILLMGIRI